MDIKVSCYVKNLKDNNIILNEEMGPGVFYTFIVTIPEENIKDEHLDECLDSARMDIQRLFEDAMRGEIGYEFWPVRVGVNNDDEDGDFDPSDLYH